LRVPPLSLQESCPLYPFCRVGAHNHKSTTTKRGISRRTPCSSQTHLVLNSSGTSTLGSSRGLIPFSSCWVRDGLALYTGVLLH
jgi:hypothetical protein